MAYTNINKPSNYFNTKLYTGTGATQSITGVGFQPDFLWIKSRGLARSNQINDAVRGAGKILATDNTGAEFTDTDRITTLDSDGFTLGSNDNVNGSSDNLVSWNWLANGAGVSNTDGSITSTVSANTTSGFSIVSYTGTGAVGTVGHSLGVAPSFIIVKNRSIENYWGIYHKSLTANNTVVLNATNASASSDLWNYTEPTSSVFSLGSVGPNASGNSIIAYCFAEKKGFSKFGSYTGNGSEDGPFIYTGFAPAFVIIKITSATGDWTTYDNKRITYNPRNVTLRPNNSNAEATSTTVNNVDFLSNGFKPRKTNGDLNLTGNNYIYMAFAEHPLVSSTGVPCTAR